MTEGQGVTAPVRVGRDANVLTTPTGLQSMDELRRRRLLVIALNVVTWGLMMWGAAHVMGAGGWTVVDIIMFVAFAPSSASNTSS